MCQLFHKINFFFTYIQLIRLKRSRKKCNTYLILPLFHSSIINIYLIYTSYIPHNLSLYYIWYIISYILILLLIFLLFIFLYIFIFYIFFIYFPYIFSFSWSWEGRVNGWMDGWLVLILPTDSFLFLTWFSLFPTGVIVWGCGFYFCF